MSYYQNITLSSLKLGMFAVLFPRKLSTLNNLLESLCCSTEKTWNAIEDVIIKTMISAHPTLKHNYHTCFPNHTTGSACFEILGFDVLLDHRLRPWVLEVNAQRPISYISHKHTYAACNH